MLVKKNDGRQEYVVGKWGDVEGRFYVVYDPTTGGVVDTLAVFGKTEENVNTLGANPLEVKAKVSPATVAKKPIRKTKPKR